MPLCRFSESYFMLGVTPVENIFILNYNRIVWNN